MMATSEDIGSGSTEVTGGAEGLRADRYRMLDVDFSLSTDSREVRDFFRAAYRHFARTTVNGSSPLRLVAEMRPESGLAYAAAGEERLELSGRPMSVNRAFLFLLNSLMDRVSDYLLIHGAAVSIGGRGVILAGPPTAGKSTLVLELARRGAVFFSDDVAPVSRATGKLHAFPRAIGIRRDAGPGCALDPAGLPSGAVHELAYKYLVDPAAMGLRLPAVGEETCPVGAVILLDSLSVDRSGGDRGGSLRSRSVKRMEIALAEEDALILEELRAMRGVSDVRPAPGRPLPVYEFDVHPAGRPMSALADLCRRRRDVVLYVDEARGARRDAPAEPALSEARWTPLLLDLARELLNRSETGSLMASCGGLAGLIAEMGRTLKGARAYRLRPGQPERTAELILSIAAGRGEAEMKGES